MTFNNLNKKITFLIFAILFAGLPTLNSKNSIIFFNGVTLNEEAYTVIYHYQIAPKLSFQFINERSINYFSIKNEFSLDFMVWHLYFRNGLLYHTDKTLSLEVPLEYKILLAFPDYFMLKLLF